MGASLGEATITDTPIVAQLFGSWLDLIDHAYSMNHARAAPVNSRVSDHHRSG
jgi:hypothetical protein